MQWLFLPNSGSGIPLFSLYHMLWLISALSLSVWAALAANRNANVTRSIGITILIVEFFRVFLLFLTGELNMNFLPLHLCGIAVYICPLHAITNSELLAELIYSTLAPGALFALIFPEWLSYPTINFISLSSFGLHILICAYGAALLTSGNFRPNWRRLPLCLGSLICYGAFVYCVDWLFDVNYLFLLRPAIGSPLEWFDTILPWHVLGYLPTLALMWGILYAPLSLKASTIAAWRCRIKMHKRRPAQ